jgi:hypothetical protein
MMVAHLQSNWNLIFGELVRWKSISREGDLLSYYASDGET